MSLGGLQLPNVDLSNVDLGNLDIEGMEETARHVMEFVNKNPVVSAAVALGAGVVLTSMYWEKLTGQGK
jgi:hypothetical protein